MRFSRLMELALYDPAEGYYASGKAGVGRDGDFSRTSASARSLAKSSPPNSSSSGKLSADLLISRSSSKARTTVDSPRIFSTAWPQLRLRIAA